MRAGGYTVHQSLAPEAATVLKLSLGLARRRGHAQVTPLHVAYTLLGSSPTPLFAAAASAPAYGLLRRACARSHPGGTCAPPAVSSPYYSHPAQCRALELCFNVALNRLPTANAVAGSPSSSASSTSLAASILHQPSPTLSNALVAALKRAQANQRRGCVELQTQPPSPPGTPSTSPQQQQQPMLMIKVELDQLIVSILDDPSVSRVMREAGFSSAAIKNNLEEESNAMMLAGQCHHPGTSTPSSSPAGTAPAVPSQSFLEPYSGLLSGGYGGGVPWPPPFFNYMDVEIESPCKEEEDVMATLEVMSRKPGRRSNPIVVGDSVSFAEASVAGLMRHLELGDVPEELRGARVLRLHLSHVHVRLMTRADVDACMADLRRTIAATDTKTSGLVIYVGDMLWAANDKDDEEAPPGGFSPAEHLVAELARLLGELRAASLGRRAWLVATASYGTYMRCQRSSLEATWALQPVSVPAGGGAGLGLGLELGPRGSTSETDDGKAAQHAQFPLLDFSPREEDGTQVLCVECTRNYEIEALAVRAKAEGTSLALSFFPGWPQADEPQKSHEDDLMDLKRKWSRLCQRVHTQRSQPTRPSNATTTYSNLGLCLSFGTPSEIKHQDVKTTLSLLPPDRNLDMGAMQATSQESDTMVSSRDMKNVLRLRPNVERSSGDLKRNADDVELPREFKRWRGSCGLDLNLNLCTSSEDELAASELTNDGEASGDVSVTGSLDSHY